MGLAVLIVVGMSADNAVCVDDHIIAERGIIIKNHIRKQGAVIADGNVIAQHYAGKYLRILSDLHILPRSKMIPMAEAGGRLRRSEMGHQLIIIPEWIITYNNGFPLWECGILVNEDNGSRRIKCFLVVF